MPSMYEICIRGYDWPMTIIGDTPGKAKYNAYLEHCEVFENFQQFIRYISSCRRLWKFQPRDLFSRDIDGFETVCQYRGIPFAKIGMEVTVDGRHGVICGANSAANLDVCFDGDTFVTNCHPGYKMEFNM